jgi:hypothetical protein
MSTTGTVSSSPSAYPEGSSVGGTRRRDGTASRHQGAGAGARNSSRPVRARTPVPGSPASSVRAANPPAAQRATASWGEAR